MNLKAAVETMAAPPLAYYVAIMSLSKDNLPPFSRGTFSVRHHLTAGLIVAQVLGQKRRVDS